MKKLILSVLVSMPFAVNALGENFTIEKWSSGSGYTVTLHSKRSSGQQYDLEIQAPTQNGIPIFKNYWSPQVNGRHIGMTGEEREALDFIDKTYTNAIPSYTKIEKKDGILYKDGKRYDNGKVPSLLAIAAQKLPKEEWEKVMIDDIKDKAIEMGILNNNDSQ